MYGWVIRTTAHVKPCERKQKRCGERTLLTVDADTANTVPSPMREGVETIESTHKNVEASRVGRRLAPIEVQGIILINY